MIDHYEADVQTAQDYYPFGMQMPGRMFTALTVPGGSVTGTTQVNGFTVPVDLALTSRSGNEPTQYVASRTIDLDEGFESGTNDDVTAYLTDTSYAGSGNGGSGADGVPGAGKYRYGFNGKENDNEVKGMGDQIDYGMRVYDPRAGRFLSVDPLLKSYPQLTPYQYTSNSPIAGVDLDGKEFEWFVVEWAEKKMFGTSHLQNFREGAAKQIIKDGHELINGAKDLINKSISGPIYGNGFTTLIGGIPPGMKLNMNPEIDLEKQAVKGAIKEYGNLISKVVNSKGKERDQAIGALGFEAILFVLPGGEEADGLRFEAKELKALGESIPIAEKTIMNSQGQKVIRNFVRNEDDLLKVAEDAAGGSLDKLTQKEGKNWWIGEVNDKTIKIEWEPEGHEELNEGPHVRIQEWIEDAGKKGKGKWSNGEKYFIQGQEKLKPLKNKK